MTSRGPAPLELSICCRSNVQKLEIRHSGDPVRPGRPFDPSTGVYERDELLLACWKCGKQWTRPYKLVVRPNGSCVVE